MVSSRRAFIGAAVAAGAGMASGEELPIVGKSSLPLPEGAEFEGMAGAYAALVTPYKNDGSVNEEMIERIVEYGLANGLRGFYLTGSTGEGFLLSKEERKLVYDRVVKAARGRAKLIAHVGCMATQDAVELARYAAKAGVDWVSSVAPVYFGQNFDAAYAHYREISSATDLPFMIYSVGAQVVPDRDAWLRAKALDFLVVGGYFQLEPWRKTADRVQGYGVRCYASLDETRIDQMVRRQKGRMLPGRNDKECWIARIAAAMASGMDGVNLFNIEYFNHEVQRSIMQHDIRDLDGVDKTYFATYVGGGGYTPEYFLVGGRKFWKTLGVNPAWPVKLAKGEGRPFEFVFGDDLAAAKRKGKSAKVEVFVLTDLKGTVPPCREGSREGARGRRPEGRHCHFRRRRRVLCQGRERHRGRCARGHVAS